MDLTTSSTCETDWSHELRHPVSAIGRDICDTRQPVALVKLTGLMDCDTQCQPLAELAARTCISYSAPPTLTTCWPLAGCWEAMGWGECRAPYEAQTPQWRRLAGSCPAAAAPAPPASMHGFVGSRQAAALDYTLRYQRP
eukprot:1140071-Pelagomonas_calceolata.AAC.3